MKRFTFEKTETRTVDIEIPTLESSITVATSGRGGEPKFAPSATFGELVIHASDLAEDDARVVTRAMRILCKAFAAKYLPQEKVSEYSDEG